MKQEPIKYRNWINFPDGRRVLFEDLSKEEQVEVANGLAIQMGAAFNLVPKKKEKIG